MIGVSQLIFSAQLHSSGCNEECHLRVDYNPCRLVVKATKGRGNKSRVSTLTTTKNTVSQSFPYQRQIPLLIKIDELRLLVPKNNIVKDSCFLLIT